MPLAALADPTRRAVFELLGEGPRAVGELARDLPVSRPAVSQHLRVLKEAGLVMERRNGTRRLYRIDPGGVDALREYFEAFWTQALAKLQGGGGRRAEEDVMSTQATGTAVKRSVTVNRSVEDAFRLFTEGMSTWWPLDSHSIGKDGVDPEAAVLEGREGGRLYERMADGDTSHWGTVLVWEPPTRVVVSWELRPDRPATVVDVRFTPAGDGARVDLEHRGWEQLGDEADEAKASYGSGWEVVLGRYAERANQA